MYIFASTRVLAYFLQTRVLDVYKKYPGVIFNGNSFREKIFIFYNWICVASLCIRKNTYLRESSHPARNLLMDSVIEKIHFCIEKKIVLGLGNVKQWTSDVNKLNYTDFDAFSNTKSSYKLENRREGKKCAGQMCSWFVMQYLRSWLVA